MAVAVGFGTVRVRVGVPAPVAVGRVDGVDALVVGAAEGASDPLASADAVGSAEGSAEGSVPLGAGSAAAVWLALSPGAAGVSGPSGASAEPPRRNRKAASPPPAKNSTAATIANSGARLGGRDMPVWDIDVFVDDPAANAAAAFSLIGPEE